MKATAMGYKFTEIPAILEWKTYKHEGKRIERKSSSKVKRLIVTHTLFSIFANPVRYAWAGCVASLLAGSVFFIWAIVLYVSGDIAVYNALTGLLLFVLGIVLFVMGVVLQQGNMIQREMWLLRQAQETDQYDLSEPREYNFEKPDSARNAVDKGG